MRVKATKMGFYAGHRRREGQEFTLAKPEDFSDAWMQALEQPKGKPGRKPKPEGAEARTASPGPEPVTGGDAGDI